MSIESVMSRIAEIQGGFQPPPPKQISTTPATSTTELPGAL
jgi:hypothetical protein